MQNGDRTRNPIPGAQEVGPQDHKYDTLTNLEILDAIDRMVAEDDENTMDTDSILAYLDILQERAPVAEDYDPNQAWEVFKQNNPSFFEEDSAEEIAAQAKTPAQRKLRFRRLIGSIAAAAALICMVTVVSSASLRNWIREAYEGSFVYRFFNSEETPTALPDYEITDLPEGYELIASEYDDVSGIKLYGLGESQIGLMYFRTDNSGDFTIFSMEDNQYQHSAVSIHEISADLYMADDATLPNELVWIDEQNNIGFQLSCFFDSSLMIKLAESVSAINR